jgi:putative ABC transport system permease protein
MGPFLRDIGFSARALRKNLSFTLVAVLTIGLGIGASTAIFSVVNAVLLRPLPYTDAERLVLVWGDLRARDVFDFPFPPADFADLREQGTLFEQLEAVQTFRATVSGDNGQPEQIRVAGVTADLLPLLGMKTAIGRSFRADDAAPPPPPPPNADPQQPPPQLPQTVILSHGFWQSRYGSDPSVIGRMIDIGNQRAEVIGVLAANAELLFPPGTNIERSPDLWTPIRIDFAGGSRINVFLRVIGKLKPGVTVEAAQAQVERLAADLRREFPIKQTADLHFRVEPMHKDLVADVRSLIVALMGAVLFVLLIACANVANLMLVRSAARERELAVRAALGGSRWRLMAQVLSESLVLGAGGALLGLVSPARVLQLYSRSRLRTAAHRRDRDRSARARLHDRGQFPGGIRLWARAALRASRTDVADVLREAGRNEAWRAVRCCATPS